MADQIITAPMSHCANGVGKLLEAQALVIGSNTIAHGLGRAPVGAVPYHSASESTPAHSFVTKTGNQDVTAGAWTIIAGWAALYAWTPSDPYADFNTTTGIYTVRRTSVISARATVLITSLLNGSAASARIRNITGGISSVQNAVLGADGSALLSIPFLFPCQAADQLAVEVIVGDDATVAALAGASSELQTSFSASCSDKVEVYNRDATNLYVHSDYAHTRSFHVW